MQPPVDRKCEAMRRLRANCERLRHFHDAGLDSDQQVKTICRPSTAVIGLMPQHPTVV